MKKLYGIFGGNFDPIHYGHIYLAKRLSKEINLTKMIFLPNNHPPHRKQTKTLISDKINMIRMVVNQNSLFKISYLETHSDHCCYTIDTLKKIRKKIHYSKSLCFIIGEDNLKNFHLWKDWNKILMYTHLIICPRKNKNNQLNNWINNYIIHDHNLLRKKSFGYIFVSQIPCFDVSSTQIRKNYSLGKSCDTLLPSCINDYILRKKLYFSNTS